MELDRLLAVFKRVRSDYDNLKVTERKAILSNPAAADHPQPVDYGVTYYELHLDALGWLGDDKPRDDLRYKKQSKWLSFLHGWGFVFTIWFSLYVLGFVAFAVYNPLPGGWTWSNPRAFGVFFLGMVFPGFFGIFAAIPISLGLKAILLATPNLYKRRHPSAGLLAYLQALCLHELYIVAAREAQQAAHEAEQATLQRKRSYWEFLDGYEFERATAEVLERHQFNPRVTPGSADGGVDIEVTRGGYKGVVQCKAHVACVGPHVVRDLYGVIHHTGAHFGIIVSRGGFTQGAIDFARNKPILFLDISDLIAMQEGRDVLAAAFAQNQPS